MSDIDWSSAPEGYDYWVTGSYIDSCFCMLDDGLYRTISGNYWPIMEGGLKATKRPEPVKWNGDGLPPVGTVCDIEWHSHTESKCEVTYMGDGVGAYKRDTGSGIKEYTFSTDSVRFRPSLTEEERAVEEMTRIMMKACSYGDQAKALYKAGYKKVE